MLFTAFLASAIKQTQPMCKLTRQALADGVCVCNSSWLHYGKPWDVNCAFHTFTYKSNTKTGGWLAQHLDLARASNSSLVFSPKIFLSPPPVSQTRHHSRKPKPCVCDSWRLSMAECFVSSVLERSHVYVFVWELCVGPL